MKKNMLAISMTAFIAACGGGSSGDDSTTTPTTGTGYFKDAKVSGLSYVSGDQSGVTDALGKFTYENGEPVTFSLGGIELGAVDGKSVVTPIDLVTSGSSSNTKVQNIVRFLLMLDSDGDPSNGIEISNAVQQAAENWSQVDFSTSDLQSALTAIMSDVASVEGRTPTLPSATEAQQHMEATFRCAYSGAFKGTFTGDDAGDFGFVITADTGDLAGVAYNNDNVGASVSGVQAMNYTQNPSFSGSTSGGATFNGQFSSPDSISGSWNDSANGASGTFSGSRIGGDPEAAYRFTGVYAGSDQGLFAFDIDDSGSVTGVAYSVPTNTLTSLSGTVDMNSGSMTGSTSDGASVSGTINLNTGVMSGTWSNGSDSGTFAGKGCKLN